MPQFVIAAIMLLFIYGHITGNSEGYVEMTPEQIAKEAHEDKLEAMRLHALRLELGLE